MLEGTRQSFEQLRTIFCYGLLRYDTYTLVNDHALLVFELALRDRFIDSSASRARGTNQGQGTNTGNRAPARRRCGSDRRPESHKLLPQHQRQRASLCMPLHKPTCHLNPTRTALP